jgi:hypothetical protein
MPYVPDQIGEDNYPVGWLPSHKEDHPPIPTHCKHVQGLLGLPAELPILAWEFSETFNLWSCLVEGEETNFWTYPVLTTEIGGEPWLDEGPPLTQEEEDIAEITPLEECPFSSTVNPPSKSAHECGG